MSLRPQPADSHDSTEPSDMTAPERLDEVASILARGIQRLHARVLAHIPAAENLPESSSARLELAQHAGPHRVTPNPVNGRREETAC